LLEYNKDVLLAPSCQLPLIKLVVVTGDVRNLNPLLPAGIYRSTVTLPLMAPVIGAILAVPFNVKKPPVDKVPDVTVNVSVMEILPLLIVAPALLFKVKLAIEPVPVITWADDPFKVTIPEIVPVLFNAPVTLIVPVLVTVTPPLTVNDAIVMAPALLGANGVPDGMVTESVLIGTDTRFQLLAVFQSELVVPAHVLVPAALVTVIVYVFVEAFCAVTTTFIVFVPTLNIIEPDAVPLVTVEPFTVMLALASLFVGVTVILLVALLTLAVYDVFADVNVGLNVPELNVNALKSALLEPGSVIE
jgi:hypothetical protein